jgi:hypothetical protein
MVTAFSRNDSGLAAVHARALEYLNQLREHAHDNSYIPASLPKYAQYLPSYQQYGNAAVIRFLVDQMVNPEDGRAGSQELQQYPPWTNLAELERLLQPWLICDQVGVDQAPKEQVIRILASPHDVIARTHGGQFVGMIDVRRVERDIVRQLVARAPE